MAPATHLFPFFPSGKSREEGGKKEWRKAKSLQNLNLDFLPKPLILLCNIGGRERERGRMPSWSNVKAGKRREKGRDLDLGFVRGGFVTWSFLYSSSHRLLPAAPSRWSLEIEGWERLLLRGGVWQLKNILMSFLPSFFFFFFLVVFFIIVNWKD